MLVVLGGCGGSSKKSTVADAADVATTNDTTTTVDQNTPDVSFTDFVQPDTSVPDTNVADTNTSDTVSCSDDGLGVASYNASGINNFPLDGTTQNLVFCQEGDSDWFKLDVTKAGVYHIELSYNGVDKYHDIAVFGSNGTDLVDNSLDDGAGSDGVGFNALSVRLEVGTYYVQFEAYQGAGSYQVKILPGCTKDADCTGSNEYCSQDTNRCTQKPTKSACTGTDDDYEVNISDSTASELTLTSNVGKIDAKICDDDSDWFYMTFDDGDKVTITLTLKCTAPCDESKDGRLIGLLHDYDTLATVGFTGNRGDFSKIELYGLKGGKYFLEVLKDGATTTTQLYDYTIDVTVEKGLGCKTDLDCSATSPLKGKCLGAGVCGSIQENKTLDTGDLCDSNGDCKSEICTNFGTIQLDIFTSLTTSISDFTGGRNVCTVECKTNADCSAISGTYCMNALFGSNAICAKTCDKDNDCPYDPGFGDYAYCNKNGTVAGGKYTDQCVLWNCTTDAHCSKSTRGPKCGVVKTTNGDEVLNCGCTQDTECQALCPEGDTDCQARAWCNIPDSASFGSCAKKECLGDTDCTTSSKGKICNLNKPFSCSCNGNTNNCLDAVAQICDATTDTCRTKECDGSNTKLTAVGCQIDSDCKANSTDPTVCSSGSCTGCTKDEECLRGTCDGGTCKANVNSDCTNASSTKVYCDAANYKCLECVTDFDCRASGNSKGGKCVDNVCTCSVDDDCKTTGLAACANTGTESAPLYRCVPCTNDGHCRNNSNPWTYVCIDNYCEECDPDKPSDDNECTGPNKNPDALGPSCELQQSGAVFCLCNSNVDCSGHKYGPVCNGDWGVCSCTGTGCTNGTSCKTQTHLYFSDPDLSAPQMCLP
ncbi:MAG: hypothetical protein KC609_07885 [Myxococcales bacterium]|nr:hypothetical protein [Myxococcales bacterium]